MSHWIILPVVLPALVASVLVLALRHHQDLQRIFSIAGSVALAALGVVLMTMAHDGTVEVYRLGDWTAPFGIVLVLDRLSAMMVMLTAALALLVVLYAVGSGWDARGHHFHALFQFQLMGICGAFLTGDLFNLFVFFEVLLIASYGLMIHAGGGRRLRAGVQYVIYNLLGSTLFLFALAILYAVTGTLNMADMAERVDAIAGGDTALLRLGVVLLLMVFAIKGALMPLHFWLPETYASAPAPVAALFAVMTKVGAYAVLRVDTLIFHSAIDATAALLSGLLLTAALATLAVGMIGMLGASGLGRLAAFAAIGSMGTLFSAMAVFTQETAAATLYYMLHSTLAGAFLFLVVDMVRERRAGGDAYAPAPAMAQAGLVTALYFGAAIAVAGMPPLAGFMGKLLILDAVRGAPLDWLIWAAILGGTLIAILGLAQGGSCIFWRVEEAEGAEVPAAPALTLPAAAAFALLGANVALTLFAGPVTSYLQNTAAQLYAPQTYISAVLGSGTGG